MTFPKCKAVMFYDKDNVLVGSVGIVGVDPEDVYIEPTPAQIESTANSALMDVFNVEEAERIVYFKVEDHYLIYE